ncbi:unnamed protein product [Aspergillus oryzae]|uniref:Unnamed protein product n=2 Tax=Aspergillus oryzae TaxID=5062 RepID=A0AAN5C0L6_ASPOZ|nr:unnamed protein product [Aspergillus oryzae]GMF84482.1 unnamed protein product [Aspergillus oryzae]GMG11131.1 unnamed protein product [Aspergillus oryzae]GMG32878.1 unnamed protein product [Aspergillus oryzae]GMG47484.1 unnamed protein product [Aspergillus oryzae var. brunneus]
MWKPHGELQDSHGRQQRLESSGKRTRQNDNALMLHCTLKSKSEPWWYLSSNGVHGHKQTRTNPTTPNSPRSRDASQLSPSRCHVEKKFSEANQIDVNAKRTDSFPTFSTKMNRGKANYKQEGENIES